MATTLSLNGEDLLKEFNPVGPTSTSIAECRCPCRQIGPEARERELRRVIGLGALRETNADAPGEIDVAANGSGVEHAIASFEPYGQWNVISHGLETEAPLQCVCTQPIKRYCVVERVPDGFTFVVGMNCIGRFLGESNYAKACALELEYNRAECRRKGCRKKVPDGRTRIGKLGVCSVECTWPWCAGCEETPLDPSMYSGRHTRCRSCWSTCQGCETSLDPVKYPEPYMVRCGACYRTHAERRVYYNIPFRDKNDAKELGARWDAAKSAWYACDRAVCIKLDEGGWKKRHATQ